MGTNFFSAGKSSSGSYTKPQRVALNEAVNLYAPTVGEGQESYTGQRVAGLTSGQLEASDLGGWSQYLQPYAPTQMYNQTGDALSGILSGQSGASPIGQDELDQFFASTYEDPARRNYEQFVKPEWMHD